MEEGMTLEDTGLPADGMAFEVNTWLEGRVTALDNVVGNTVNYAQQHLARCRRDP